MTSCLCCARSLTSLRKLSLQSNRLTSMAGLQHCTLLEELYLSHNGIQRLEVGFILASVHHAKVPETVESEFIALAGMPNGMQVADQQLVSFSL